MISSSPLKRFLLVLDFDSTVINQNTDTIFYKLLPNQNLPQDISQQYQSGQWTKFMNIVFRHLKDTGITIDQLKASQQEAVLSPGFQEVFQHVRENKKSIDVIIASDSNSFFIQTLLTKFALKDVINQVFTNWAEINDNLLTIQPHHSHDTPSCPVNLCKSKVIRDFISQQTDQYSKIVYVGDGQNDYCPISNLKETDEAFVRKGYALEKYLKQLQGEKVLNEKVKCKLNFWDDASGVISALNV